jgi:hypothetical protein
MCRIGDVEAANGQAGEKNQSSEARYADRNSEVRRLGKNKATTWISQDKQ